MSSEQDPFNSEPFNEGNYAVAEQCVQQAVLRVEDVVLGAYDPGYLNSLVANNLQDNGQGIVLQTVVNTGNNYWMLSVEHHNRDLEMINRNLQKGTFFKKIHADLLPDNPQGGGQNGRLLSLELTAGVTTKDQATLRVTDAYATPNTGEPSVLHDKAILRDQAIVQQYIELLAGIDATNPNLVYVAEKKALGLVRRYHGNHKREFGSL